MNGDMDYTTLRCTNTDRILTVTLNRPDHLNAFTPPEYHGGQDHGLLPVTLGGVLGLAHEMKNLASGVHGPGKPTLAAVEHVMLTVQHDVGGDVGGVMT